MVDKCPGGKQSLGVGLRDWWVFTNRVMGKIFKEDSSSHVHLQGKHCSGMQKRSQSPKSGDVPYVFDGLMLLSQLWWQ